MRALFALFTRTVRQDFRAKFPPILRTCLVLIVLLILAQNQRRFDRFGAPGLQLMLSVMMLNLALIAIASVSIFTNAITEEKEEETLPLLRMTNLNSLSILIGKAAPQFLAAALLLAVQIPFTLIAITLGGVSLDQILGSYAIVGATAFFMCCLALLSSVICRTTVRAGFLTGGIAAFLYIGLIMIAFGTLRDLRMGGGLPSGAWEHICTWIEEAHPIRGLVFLLEPFGVGLGGSPMAPVWWHLGGGVFCFVLAWVLFQRFCNSSVESVARPAKTASGQPRRRLFAVPRTGKRALMWKDFHFMVSGRFGFAMRCLMALGLFLAIFGYLRWISPPYEYRGSSYTRVAVTSGIRFWREVSERVIGFSAMVAVLDLLLIFGRLLGAERRGLTLSGLMSLPWSATRVLWQKIFGCLPAIIPWVSLFIIGILAHPKDIVSDFFDDLSRNDGEGLSIVLYMLTQGVIVLGLALYLSLIIRRGALPAAISIIVVWNILFAIIVDEANHSEESTVFFLGAAAGVVLAVFLHRAITRRMETAAAAD